LRLFNRYNLPILARQIAQLLLHEQDLNQVPILHEHVWSQLLVRDYRRFREETPGSPKLFADSAGAFGVPTARLPIDRLVEEIITEIALQKSRPADRAPTPVAAQQEQHQREDMQWNNDNSEPIPVVDPRWNYQNGYSQHNHAPPQPAPPAPQHYNNYYPPPPGNQIPHADQGPSQMNYAHQHYGFRVSGGQIQQNPEYSRNSDDPAERIRGGGPSTEEEKGPPLLGTSLASWHGAVVSFEAESEKKEANLFIGRVQLPNELRNGDDQLMAEIDEVLVQCFYASSVGVFAQPQYASVDPEEVFLVTEGTKYYSLLERIDRCAPLSKYSNQQTQSRKEEGGGAFQLPQQMGDVENVGRAENAMPQEGDANRPQVDASPRSAMSPEEAAKNALVEHIAFQFACQFRRGDCLKKPARMGSLPDGRLVIWYSNDPLALYVQEHSGFIDNQKAFVDSVARSNKDRVANEKICTGVDPYACLYGCTWMAKDPNTALRLAEFQNEGMLARHHKKFHSYKTSDDLFQYLGQRFIRVADCKLMKKMLGDLTSAACALSAKVADMGRTNVPATVLDDPSTGLKIASSPSRHQCHLPILQLVDIAKDTRAHGKHPLHQAVALLLKLRLFFDLDEAKGSISLSSGALKGLEWDKRRRESDGLSLNEYTRRCSCSRQSLANTSERCSLCALSSEGNILSVPKESGQMGQNVVERHPRGIGCAIPTSVLMPSSQVNAPVAPTFGKVGFAKMLLLRIASNAPSQLHACNPKSANDPCGNPKDVWKHEGKRFRTFVQQAGSVRALAQAFVVLLSAFDHDKLPLWWRQGEFGWLLSAQKLLLQPSIPSLVLHMLVLDVAIAEYISVGSKDRPYTTLDWKKESVTKGFGAVSIKRRMEMLLQSAAANSISRFRGNHEYYC
jgi:hypothetical protein